MIDAPRHPGLRDQADWTAVQLPETMGASPHGLHWAALLRLFSWQIQRLAEVEAELDSLKSGATVVPVAVALEGPDETLEQAAAAIIADFMTAEVLPDAIVILTNPPTV